jgi:hypothetical protein
MVQLAPGRTLPRSPPQPQTATRYPRVSPLTLRHASERTLASRQLLAPGGVRAARPARPGGKNPKIVGARFPAGFGKQPAGLAYGSRPGAHGLARPSLTPLFPFPASYGTSIARICPRLTVGRCGAGITSPWVGGSPMDFYTILD